MRIAILVALAACGGRSDRDPCRDAGARFGKLVGKHEEEVARLVEGTCRRDVWFASSARCVAELDVAELARCGHMVPPASVARLKEDLEGMFVQLRTKSFPIGDPAVNVRVPIPDGWKPRLEGGQLYLSPEAAGVQANLFVRVTCHGACGDDAELIANISREASLVFRGAPGNAVWEEEPTKISDRVYRWRRVVGERRRLAVERLLHNKIVSCSVDASTRDTPERVAALFAACETLAVN